jgi:hypothetical protein
VWLPRTGGAVRVTAAGAVEALRGPVTITQPLAYSTVCAGTPYPGATIIVNG